MSSYWPALRALAVQIVLGLAVTAVVGLVLALVLDTGVTDTIAAVMIGGGALWLVGGGTLLGRITALESMQWGIDTRASRVTDDRDVMPGSVTLTATGSALFVGAALLLTGTLLQW